MSFPSFMSMGDGGRPTETDAFGSRNRVSLFYRTASNHVSRFYARITSYVLYRWMALSLAMGMLFVRVISIKSHYLIVYLLFFRTLPNFLLFLTPFEDPSETEAGLPFSNQSGLADIDAKLNAPSDPATPEDWKPFLRQYPEFRLWMSTMHGTLLAITYTFTPLDIPTSWPILLGGYLIYLIIALQPRISHMIKYRYVPISVGKPVFTQ